MIIYKTNNRYFKFINYSLTAWYIEESGDGEQASSMWEMWFIYFTYARNIFTLQTRFAQVFGRSDLTLAACRKEKGIHIDKMVWHWTKEQRMTEWDNRYVNFNDIVICNDQQVAYATYVISLIGFTKIMKKVGSIFIHGIFFFQ